MFVSETYNIEDLHRYDDCSTDKSSNYTFLINPLSSNITLSDGSYRVYPSQRTHESNPVQIKIDEVNLNHYEASVDILYHYTSSHQHGAYIIDDGYGTAHSCSWTNQRVVGAYCATGGDQRTKTSPPLSADTWYTHKFIVDGNSITCQILDTNGTVLSEKTNTCYSTNLKTFVIRMSDYIDVFRFKNIKIKRL